MSKQYSHDVLIIGGGAAGMTLALKLADHADIALIAKGTLSECATLYAQGGISVVRDVEDSLQSHSPYCFCPGLSGTASSAFRSGGIPWS